MQRILILGGGVGGHAHRQPPRQEAARARSTAARSTITVVDATGEHVYQPGFMYIAMGGERAEQPPAAGARRCSTRGSTLVVGEVDADRRADAQTVDARRTACRSATTSSSWRPARGSCPRRSSTSTPRPTTSTRPRRPLELRARARRVRRRPDRHRHRRDALQVPAGAARGRVPDRGGAARARPARHERDRLLLADRPRVHDRERVARWRPRSSSEKGIELHTFFNVEAIDAERKVVQSLEGEELPLRPAHPRAAAQGPAVPDRLRSRAGAGRLAADRPAHAPGRRPAERLRPRRRDRPAALQGRLDRALRGARRAERIAAAVEGRDVDRQARRLPRAR